MKYGINLLGRLKGVKFEETGDTKEQHLFLHVFDDIKYPIFLGNIHHDIEHKISLKAKKQFGSTVFEQIQGQKAVCFTMLTDEGMDEEVVKALLRAFFHAIQKFLSFAWFIKDNAILCSDLFSWGKYTPLSRRSFYAISTCEGNFNDITITTEELKQMIYYYETYSDILNFDEIQVTFADLLNDQTSLKTKTNYNSNSRIARAYEMIDLARKESVLPIKVAFYITALESLFTCGRDFHIQGIKKAVATRTSLILGERGNEQSVVYSQIQDAYKVRSNFVHGKKIVTADLHKQCAFLDDTLRQTMLVVLEKYQAINDYPDDKILKWFAENFEK